MSENQDPDKSVPQLEYAANSQIKNIYLQIPEGYKFRHHALAENNEAFLGRTEITDSFINILESESNKGVYLVTGYRGMGKTSFVNQVIKQLKKDDKDTSKNSWLFKIKTYWGGLVPYLKSNGITPPKIREFNISLAQSQLKDVDILKHIVNQLLVNVESTTTYHRIRWFTLGNVFSWLWPALTILLISLNFYLIKSDQEGESKTIIENLVGIATLAAILAMFVHKLFSWLSDKIVRFIPKAILLAFGVSFLILCITAFLYERYVIPGLIDKILNFWNPASTHIPTLKPVYAVKGFLFASLSVLCIVASIKLISKVESFIKPGEPLNRIHERLKMLHDRCNAQITKEDQLQESFAISLSSLFNKNQKIFPIANPREIENELIQIIKMLSRYDKYIFVFDELDKVDPAFENNLSSLSDSQTDKITYLNDLRERRHLITNILASLKYFINESEAKFIFIAGREMFEAALADISDRQSSISSIFHKVIYVDSFLKDRSQGEDQVSSIGGLVETFLKNTLLTKEDHRDGNFFSQYYKHLIAPETDTKKRLTEQQARKVIFTLQNFLGYLVYRSNGSPKKMTKLFEEYIKYTSLDAPKEKKRSVIFSYSLPNPLKTNHYLVFSYMDQYKLGYTSYLFQPFLTMNSSFMKRYSDNTLVSIPYLIDNLIKFHPFAFSPQNLELLPEILATNRNPVSRPFLEDLISFLAQNHIRKTESGLYEYKFYDRTHNEITFISKLFEDEAAAFNFTLDETFSIKTHLQAKIRHLRLAHTNANSSGNPIVSIIFLNRLLGDARFQDEEYQDAIVSYQDALQMLDLSDLSSANQITSFIMLKLKLGLTYEKIKAYEFALGHYAGVIEEGSRLLKRHAQKHIIIYRELVVLIMQAFLATLYLQEKLQEGVTFQKIKHNINSFTKLLAKFTHDYENRDILLASYFSGIGTALFYKNMVLPQQTNILMASAYFEKTEKNQQEACKSLNNCFADELKDLVEDSRKELKVFNDPTLVHSDARISFSTYLYYKKSLKILIGCSKSGLIDLLSACPEMIHAKDESSRTYKSLQHTRRLSSIGHGMAKLGDFLFPLMPKASVPVEDALGCFYFDITNDQKEAGRRNHIGKAREKLLYEYIGDVDLMKADIEEHIHPRMIIHFYFLAALFYLEAGDRSNAVFQLRKVLFVLRSIKLSTNTVGASVYALLLCLEFNLIRRILELSSLMSHSSDRPQLAKMKKYFDINTLRTPHDFSNELYSNLSNNPDTKETILAYALLKCKYHQYLPASNQAGGIHTLMGYYNSIPEHKLLSPYNSISHQITRLMELDLHTCINEKILTGYLTDKIGIIRFVDWESYRSETVKIFGKDSNWEKDYYHYGKLYDIKKNKFVRNQSQIAENKAIESAPNEQKFLLLLAALKYSIAKGDWFEEYIELVLNSVFNLIQMKRILNTFGNNYILSYSYMGQVHEKLGRWLKHLHLCRILDTVVTEKKRVMVDEQLNELIGFQDMLTLDTLTEYQIAVQYYYYAIQMHKEGNIYRSRMSNLIYLEDDFNDNLYHFGAALERYKINSKAIRKSIDRLKADLQKANMYKYSTFTGDELSLTDILRNN